VKIRLLLLLALALFLPTPSRADDLAGPYVYKTSVRLNTQHYLVYYPTPTAKEPQYLTGSWAPKLNFNLQGPVEGGSQLTVKFTKPNGAPWITKDLPTDETAADSYKDYSLDGIDMEKQAINVGGTFGVSIVLSNALSGTKKELFNGKFQVVKFHYGTAPNEVHQADFWVNHDWNLPIGQLSFDESNSTEAPQLLIKMWFRGPIQTEMLGGYIYYNGKQITSTKTEGNIAPQVTIEPGTTRPDLTYTRCSFLFSKIASGRFGDSANNYDSTWFLDKHPGDYEVKILRNGKPARSTKFTIGPDGKLVDNGLATANKMGLGVTLLPITCDLSQDSGATTANYKSLAFYGNPVTGFP